MIKRTDKLEGYLALRELALDLRWSWNHALDILWQELDAETWEATRNPWVVLRTVSFDRLDNLLSTPQFAGKLEELLAEKRVSERAPAWFQQSHLVAPIGAIAYFSMEFMLSEALPIYSGGLGNVAGDQLKAASDLGIPVVGVGLLYAQGYFRQMIGPDGHQEALYPVNEPDQLPIQPVRTSSGEWLRLQIDLPGCTLWLRTWEVQVGRTKLYLLDMNDLANPAIYRCITSEPYGGGPETRLKQEMILGIGGWQLLHALGIVRWKQEVSMFWPLVHFGEISIEETKEYLSFSVEVYLGGLSPDMVKVELYADGEAGQPSHIEVMERQPGGSVLTGYSRYAARISSVRPASEFTPRLIPYHPLVRSPLERPNIIWHR